jgi:hypothetical protein
VSTSQLQPATDAGAHMAHKQRVTDGKAWGAGGFSAAQLTLNDVARTQRWAWRPARSAPFPTYSFDGINFWWQPRRHERVMIARAVVPSDGWRHRVSCNCEVCSCSGFDDA